MVTPFEARASWESFDAKVNWHRQQQVVVQAKALLHWIRKQDPDRAAKAARLTAHFALPYMAWLEKEGTLDAKVRGIRHKG
jgi:hypothetical protein